MNVTLEVSGLIVIAAVGFRIAAAVYYALVIWYAYKEFGIKNGLIRLRKQLLIIAAILFFINTTGIGLVVIRDFISVDIYRLLTDSITIINSVGLFVVGYLFHQIYIQQYSDYNKELHSKFEAAEKQQALK